MLRRKKTCKSKILKNIILSTFLGMRDRIDQEPDTLIASKEIKQQEFIMACFYELILLHNKIYGRCNEFLRAIIFRKYISQSNKSSNVTHLLPPFPEVFYTKL